MSQGRDGNESGINKDAHQPELIRDRFGSKLVKYWAGMDFQG